MIVEVGAYLVLKFEHVSSSANILTANDAVWWVYVTITTVGYGDRFPVTMKGRLVGILVLTTGVTVFATFTGLISSKLLSSPNKDEDEVFPDSLTQNEIDFCRTEIEKLY